MFRNAVFASLIALGVAGAAQAQAPSTRDLAGHLPGGNAGNVVGGRSATIVGGGDNHTILYDQPGAGGGGAGWSQAGRIARFGSTQGDGPQIEYADPAPGGGREAWLSGGGDNAEVVYTRPR